MRRCSGIRRLSIATIWALLLILSWSSTSRAWERVSEAQVSEGWTATEPGYFYTDAEVRRIQQALKNNRERAEHWYAVHLEDVDDAIATMNRQDTHVNNLIGHLTTERDTTDKAIEIAAKRKNFGWGFFAGVGYTPHGVEPTIGVGAVWLVH